jgi:hypothetical protein
MAEPWVVIPLASVRFRPATPKCMDRPSSSPAGETGRRGGLKHRCRQGMGVRNPSPGTSAMTTALIHPDFIPSWRNRQTRLAQNQVPHGRAGSTPAEGPQRLFGPIAQWQSSALIRRRSMARSHLGQPGHQRGCSSRVEQPAFNRQVRVRSPASAPDVRRLYMHAFLTRACMFGWGVAQLVEQRVLIPLVGGSSPPALASDWRAMHAFTACLLSRQSDVLTRRGSAVRIRHGLPPVNSPMSKNE